MPTVGIYRASRSRGAVRVTHFFVRPSCHTGLFCTGSVHKRAASSQKSPLFLPVLQGGGNWGMLCIWKHSGLYTYLLPQRKRAGVPLRGERPPLRMAGLARWVSLRRYTQCARKKQRLQSLRALRHVFSALNPAGVLPAVLSAGGVTPPAPLPLNPRILS